MMKRIASIVLLSIMATLCYSASKDVMILFNGTSQLNRHIINFINKEFRGNNIQYNLKLTQNPSDIKPGVYKAIVVVSTGYNTGTDPKLAKFISDYKNKKEVILLNFKSNDSNLFVEYTIAKKTPEGVDAITSATAWERMGRQSKGTLPKSGDGVTVTTYNSPIDMHAGWLEQLLKLISVM